MFLKPGSNIFPVFLILGTILLIVNNCHGQSYDSLQQKILKLEVAQKDLQ